MSAYNGHKLGGYIATVVVLISLLLTINIHRLNITEFIVCSICTLFFSLFPDVDIKSIASKMFYTIVLISLLILFVYDRHEIGMIVSIISIIPQLLNHRGLLHRWWVAISLPSIIFIPMIMGNISSIFSLCIYISSVVGYSTHLILDRND